MQTSHSCMLEILTNTYVQKLKKLKSYSEKRNEILMYWAEYTQPNIVAQATLFFSF
jgi:hypothetical protein